METKIPTIQGRWLVIGILVFAGIVIFIAGYWLFSTAH
jgi:hypothetical protein